MSQEIELKGLLQGIADDVKDLSTRVGAVEESAKNAPSRGVSLPGVNEGSEKFSFAKAVLGMTSGNWSEAGFEKSVFDETRKRALSMGTASAGGYVVPNEYIPELIDLLRNNTSVMAAGATQMTGLNTSPIQIPRQTGGATAYWIAESPGTPGVLDGITESQQSFDQITMSPHALAGLVRMTNTVLRMSNPSIEAIVRRDLAATMAARLDLEVLQGTGTGNSITGIANTSGISVLSLGANGAVPSIDDMYNLLYKLEQNNTDNGNMAFIVNPRTVNTLRKLRSAGSTGDYLFQPDPTRAVAGTLLGLPVIKSNQVPVTLTQGTASGIVSQVFLANWSDLIIGEWFGLTLSASSEAADTFLKDETLIRVIQSVDVAVRHPESFALMTGVLE